MIINMIGKTKELKMTRKRKKIIAVKKEIISKFYDSTMICPHCKFKLEDSINKDYVRCNSCFSHFKRESSYFTSESNKVKDHYIKNLSEILNLDKGHYDRFFNFDTTSRVKLLYSEMNRIVSFGGGFPKLESYLNPKVIKVYDLFPDVYRSQVKLFREIFNFNGKLEFIKFELNENSIDCADIKENDLITFVHILEHFHYDQIIEMFSNLPSNITVSIYSPNVGRQPTMGKDWLHFVAPDHITLLSLNSMVDIIKQLGYNIIIKYPYDCDMMIIFKT